VDSSNPGQGGGDTAGDATSTEEDWAVNNVVDTGNGNTR
jgi:hypothetical protein